MVIYNGKAVYNAPKNLWNLFTDPVMAKQYMTEDYQSNSKLPQERQTELVDLLDKYLSAKEKDNIMRTVAQKYIEEGKTRGIQIGKAEGIQIGEARGEANLLRIMIAKGNSIKEIADITGLSISRIKELLKVKLG